MSAQPIQSPSEPTYRHPLHPILWSLSLLGIHVRKGTPNTPEPQGVRKSLLRLHSLVSLLAFHYWAFSDIAWYFRNRIREDMLAESVTVWAAVGTVDLMLLVNAKTLGRVLETIREETDKMPTGQRDRYRLVVKVVTGGIWVYVLGFMIQYLVESPPEIKYQRYFSNTPLYFFYTSMSHRGVETYYKIDRCVECLFVQGALTFSIALYVLACWNARLWYRSLGGESGSSRVWYRSLDEESDGSLRVWYRSTRVDKPDAAAAYDSTCNLLMNDGGGSRVVHPLETSSSGWYPGRSPASDDATRKPGEYNSTSNEEDCTDVRRFRIRFERLCKGVYRLDSAFSLSAALWLLMIVVNLCVRILCLLNRECRTQAIPTVTLAVARAALTLVTACLSAHEVTREASEAAARMLVARGGWGQGQFQEAQLSQVRLTFFPVQLTAWKFAALNRGFLMTSVGVMATYVIICIQLNPSAMESLAG